MSHVMLVKIISFLKWIVQSFVLWTRVFVAPAVGVDVRRCVTGHAGSCLACSITATGVHVRQTWTDKHTYTYSVSPSHTHTHIHTHALLHTSRVIMYEWVRVCKEDKHVSNQGVWVEGIEKVKYKTSLTRIHVVSFPRRHTRPLWPTIVCTEKWELFSRFSVNACSLAGLLSRLPQLFSRQVS